MASPERPTGLVEGDRYDTSVAAEVIVGKHGYHLPIYRQQDYFAGSGWIPSRSTSLNLMVASAFVIRPLIEHFKQAVLNDSVIGTDDTSVTLLLPKDIPYVYTSTPTSTAVTGSTMSWPLRNAVAASSLPTPSDQVCRSFLVWTPEGPQSWPNGNHAQNLPGRSRKFGSLG